MSRVFCVPYGVDANVFQPPTVEQRKAIRLRLGIGQSATVVGFFGKNSSNDDDRKGIDVFTKAALDLQARIPELVVLIVGPGWQHLVNTLNKSGLECVWMPFVKEIEELSRMYHALDFYWVTARVEGGPVTLLEAMSTEVCCLSTAVGIAPEIIKDGDNGVMLPFNDADAFAERTAALAVNANEVQRLGVNARKTILEKMHVAVTAKGVFDVYARAFENFAERRQQMSPLDVRSIAEATVGESVNETGVPLHGFPRVMHKRVGMLESLAFSEHLILYHKQRSVAVRMIMREWLANPFSPLPLRVLLRRLLPVPMVASVVKLKNRSRSTPELVAH
jgi:hypothetical protein